MNNLTSSVIIFAVSALIIAFLFGKMDCKNKKHFELNFDDQDLKCKCDIEHFDNYDKTEIETHKTKKFQIEKTINSTTNKENTYTNNIVHSCYYNIAPLSAESYYNKKYNTPIKPLENKDTLDTVYINNNASICDNDNILDDKDGLDNDHIFG